MDLRTYLESERGRAAGLARALGLTSIVVSRWVTGAKQVPAERCPAIEAWTGGQVTCEELRAEIPWAVLRGTGSPNAQAERRGVAPPEQHHGLSPFAMGVDRREHGDAELADEGAR